MPNKFDRIIQENFQGFTRSLMIRILNVQKIEIVSLPRKVQYTLEREMDSLLKIALSTGDEGLLNVEWQVDNDPKMCLRMLLYHAHSALKYELPVIGVVVYIGQYKVNMPVSIEYENIKYRYRLIDFTELNPEIFLESDIPEEIIMAALAGKTKYAQKREIIRKILFKLRWLLQHDSAELNRRLLQFEIIGELRNIQKLIIEEENKMALTYNIERDIRYNQGIEKATTEKNTDFVKYLLQNTTHSIEEIAKLVNTPVEFVKKVKQTL